MRERFGKGKEDEQRAQMPPSSPKEKDVEWVRLAKVKAERLAKTFSAPMLGKKRLSRWYPMVQEENQETEDVQIAQTMSIREEDFVVQVDELEARTEEGREKPTVEDVQENETKVVQEKKIETEIVNSKMHALRM